MILRRQNEGKGALAVQGGDKGAYCAKCFAPMSGHLDACPECGAPVRSGVTSIDTTTSADIARANLLRMRGDYKAAVEVCLKILKQFPNHAAAHTLLGDISAAQGDWVQAVSWYELALDIVPESASDAQKLLHAKQRVGEGEQMSAAEHLGINDTPGRHYLYAGIGLLLVFTLVVVAYSYFASAGEPTVREPDPSLNAPLTLPDRRQASQQVPVVEQPPAGKTAEEIEMLGLIRGKAEVTERNRLLDVVFLPTDSKITLSYTSLRAENDRVTGAKLADAAFTALSGIRSITLRALAGGKMTFTAESRREVWDKVQEPAWRRDHTDEEWVQEMLGLSEDSAAVEPSPSDPKPAEPKPAEPEPKDDSQTDPPAQSPAPSDMPGDI